MRHDKGRFVEGSGTNEKGIVESIDNSRADPGITLKPGDTVVAIDPRYYRPAEVETLLGDPSLARELLGWQPKYGSREGFLRGLTETIAWFREPANLSAYKAEIYNI